MGSRAPGWEADFPCGLTGLARCSYVGRLAGSVSQKAPGGGCSRHEENLPAESYPKEAKPWLPRPDADSKWPSDHQAPPSKRAETLGCLRIFEIEVRKGAARLRRTNRLRESRDFRRLSQQGARVASPHFVAVIGEQRRDTGGLEPVLGVTVSKKVGTAVERNRVKRRIREWFRRNRSVLPPNAAVVVIARRGAADLEVGETERELGDLLR